MSKPSDVAAMSVLAAASFWLGSQPIFIGVLAYSKFWLGEGVGYERGLGGFLGGAFLWGLFSAVPAAAFFIVVLAMMLLRKTVGGQPVRLYVYSGLLGLLWSGLYWLVCLGVLHSGMDFAIHLGRSD